MSDPMTNLSQRVFGKRGDVTVFGYLLKTKNLSVNVVCTHIGVVITYAKNICKQI